jgi:hypothetical protein
MSDDDLTPRQAGRKPDATHRAGDPGNSADVPRFHGWHLLIGTLATPAAWLAQMLIGGVLTTQACALRDANPAAATPAWIMPAMLALSVACLVLGVAGVIVAWRAVFITREQSRRAPTGRPHQVAELEWFLARVSALSSVIFLFGLISIDLALQIMSPCGNG